MDFEHRAQKNVQSHSGQEEGAGDEEGPWRKKFSANGIAARIDIAGGRFRVSQGGGGGLQDGLKAVDGL